MRKSFHEHSYVLVFLIFEYTDTMTEKTCVSVCVCMYTYALLYTCIVGSYPGVTQFHRNKIKEYYFFFKTTDNHLSTHLSSYMYIYI